MKCSLKIKNWKLKFKNKEGEFSYENSPSLFVVAYLITVYFPIAFKSAAQVTLSSSNPSRITFSNLQTYTNRFTVTVNNRLSAADVFKFNNSCPIVRWPLLLTGKNSDKPCTNPSNKASNQFIIMYRVYRL